MQADNFDIQANVVSVERVPRSILPGGPAREALMEIIQAGFDCYCYASGGETLGTWCVWLQPLADAHPLAHDGRVPLTQWCAQWRELLAEAGKAVRP